MEPFRLHATQQVAAATEDFITRRLCQASAILAAFAEETSQLGNTEHNRKIMIVFSKYGKLLWVSSEITACFAQIHKVNPSRS